MTIFMRTVLPHKLPYLHATAEMLETSKNQLSIQVSKPLYEYAPCMIFIKYMRYYSKLYMVIWHHIKYCDFFTTDKFPMKYTMKKQCFSMLSCQNKIFMSYQAVAMHSHAFRLFDCSQKIIIFYCSKDFYYFFVKKEIENHASCSLKYTGLQIHIHCLHSDTTHDMIEFLYWVAR